MTRRAAGSPAKSGRSSPEAASAGSASGRGEGRERDGGAAREVGDVFSKILPLDPSNLELEGERLLYRLQRDPDLFPGSTCLDAGCGLGEVVSAMRGLGARRVVGVDIGAHARAARATNADSSNVLVARANVLRLPLASRVFDVVHSSGVLHHTTDLRAGIDELVRVLRPGGLIYVAVVGREGLQAVVTGTMRLLAKIVPQPKMSRLLGGILPSWMVAGLLDVGYAPIRRTYSEAQMRAELARHGILDVQRTRSERYDYRSWTSRLWWGVGWVQLSGFKPRDEVQP